MTSGACGLALALLCSGCPGEVETPRDGGIDCPASVESGLWLLHFGPLSQDLLLGGTAKVTVVVVRGSAEEGKGRPEQGHPVRFRLPVPGAGVTLSAEEVSTDDAGLSSVQVEIAGDAEPNLYQVEASADGTCPLTFTIDATRPLRQLRAVTPSPYDTFTFARIPITVEATTNGYAPLAGEQITFTIDQGKTAETKYSNVDGSGAADTLQVTTDGSGRATAMLTTGSQPIATLSAVASLDGTADAIVQLRVHEGADHPCESSADCPLGYNCNTTSGTCEPPPPGPGGSGCQPGDCQPPTVCDEGSGKCLELTGEQCDPIEGTGCNPGEVCIGSQCAKLPTGGCQSNDDCPASWVCVAGDCQPEGQPPTGGCQVPADCDANQTCINGQCIPKTACNIVHDPDRLKGTWQYDSHLSLRDALSGFLGGLLKASEKVRDLIEGRFSIGGLPGFIEDMVEDYLKSLIDEYVPPWGQQLIVALGNISDVIDDMRVISTVQQTSVGNDSYVHSEQWDLVEFEYKGQKISSPPSAIPEIGQVKVSNYTSTEVCGVLFISKHKIKNVVGGLIKWAIETALSLVTCNTQGVPCYNSVGEALEQTIDCVMLSIQIDDLIWSIWSSAPSVSGIVEAACEAAKQDAINKINQELESLTTGISALELSGTVDIPNPGQDSQLNDGRWHGWLGSGILKGDFDGSFDAFR